MVNDAIQRLARNIKRAPLTKDPEALMVGIQPLSRQEPPRRGTAEILRAWRTMPWFRAATRKISRTVGATQWQVMVQTSTTPEGERRYHQHKAAQRATGDAQRKILDGLRRSHELVELDSHPLLDLLVNSNPFFPGNTAMELLQVYLDTIGEAMFLVEKGASLVPIGLWPIPATWVTKKPTTADPNYTIKHRGYEGKIPMEDVVWFEHHDPENPYGRGTGTGVSLADEIETDEYAAKHTKAFFFNRARPDTIISGKGLGQKETARLEQDYLRRHQGFWKHFKPWFLSTEIKVHTLSNDFSDQKVTELRKFERDTILQVLDVSPEIMGIMENANRASIQASLLHFMLLSVSPRIDFIRSVLQVTLVPQFDERLILGFVSPVPDDKEFKLKVMARAPWAFPMDDWRELAGMVPVNGTIGTLHPVQSGIQFAQPEELEGINEIPPVVAGLPVVPEPERSVKQIEVQKVLSDTDIETIVAALDPGDLDDATKVTFTNTVTAFAEKMIDDNALNIVWDETDPAVVQFLGDYSSTKITGINTTTRGRVRAVLAQGREAGETSAQLAKRVTGVMDEARGARAFTIARTETVGAAGFGNNQALIQAGVQGKEWLTTRDDTVRDTHQGLDDVAVKVKDSFETANGSALHPGGFGVAEEDINCRCTLLAVLDLSNRSMLTTEQKDTLWKAFEDDREPHERKLRAAFRGAFTTQEGAVLAQLRRLG